MENILPNELSMSEDRIDRVGFAHPTRQRARARRRAALAGLIAVVALVASLAVAATAVSIGIARADVLTDT
jgi:hypothetical protein